MSNKSSNSNSINGVSLIFAALTVLFIAFKLAGIGEVANWSWFWVLSPVWIPLAAILVILAAAGLIWAIASISLYIKAKRRGVRLSKRR